VNPINDTINIIVTDKAKNGKSFCIGIAKQILEDLNFSPNKHISINLALFLSI
jgi:hypothetical protein